jgi:hypothetical protein
VVADPLPETVAVGAIDAGLRGKCTVMLPSNAITGSICEPVIIPEVFAKATPNTSPIGLV